MARGPALAGCGRRGRNAQLVRFQRVFGGRCGGETTLPANPAGSNHASGAAPSVVLTSAVPGVGTDAAESEMQMLPSIIGHGFDAGASVGSVGASETGCMPLIVMWHG